jgi:hypothetical protein
MAISTEMPKDHELLEEIRLYEDIILAELLAGKTREEIVATLQSTNRIEYDEHFILRKLMEGKSREEIAKILKHIGVIPMALPTLPQMPMRQLRQLI